DVLPNRIPAAQARHVDGCHYRMRARMERLPVCRLLLAEQRRADVHGGHVRLFRRKPKPHQHGRRGRAHGFASDGGSVPLPAKVFHRRFDGGSSQELTAGDATSKNRTGERNRPWPYFSTKRPGSFTCPAKTSATSSAC